MKIYVTRHGQTDYNAAKLMQGQIDIPLNEKGKSQARAVGEKLAGVKFDKVFASTLVRAVTTASLISGVPEDEVVKDERIIEAAFGDYEGVGYFKVSIPMFLYWGFPEIFPCPKKNGVEDIPSMVARIGSFLSELEKQDYENVLLVCHGGIIRVIRGYLEDSKKGFIWRPRPKNCEVFVYESVDGKHKLVEDIK